MLALLVLAARDPLGFGDFRAEAWPAYAALQGGDVGGLLARSPAYSGFLVLASPLAVLIGALGGGPAATFRATALPGLIALAALALALGRRGGWAAALAVVASPVAYEVVRWGHAEDLLAASAAVLAVLAARDGRGLASGALLALAIVSKQWAVLALGPALLAARERRLAILIPAAAALAAVAALALAHPERHAALTDASGAFTATQLWWPVGAHGWLDALAHPLIVALALPLSVLAWRAGTEPLRLLALLFLLRCLLDPWNVSYYHLPLVLALGAYEVRARRGFPWAAAAVGVLAVLTTGFGAYMAWALPLLAWLALGAPPLPSAACAVQTSAAPRSSRSTSTI